MDISHIRTYIHTYLPTYIHACIHTYIYIYLPTYIHTCMHACMHTYIHTCMHACMHTYIRTHIHTYIHVHTYIHTHTYMHACMHAYIHTWIHACIHTYIHACMHAYIHTHIHTYIHACVHTCMHAYIHTWIHACIHTYMHACMHAYIHTCMHACIHTYILRMGIHSQYNQYPQVHSRIISSQGTRIMMLLWLKTPTAGTQQNMAKHELCRSPFTLDHWKHQLETTIQDQKRYSIEELRIHRLSAVGLSQSLRAGNCGPHNQWLKRTVAITHSHLLDMPPHQLPARSQILHRVSILVEAKPQN